MRSALTKKGAVPGNCVDPVKFKMDQDTRKTQLLDLLRQLHPSNYGKTDFHTEENQLYAIALSIKQKITSYDKEIIGELAQLLQFSPRNEHNISIEELRRQIIVYLLEDFLKQKLIQKAVRKAHIEKPFLFTFRIRTTEKPEGIHIDLSPKTCDFLRELKGDLHAYSALDTFLGELDLETRKKIDRKTAQYLDQGGKRYAFRIQYDGHNAVLLIGIEGDFFRKDLEREAEIYKFISDLIRTGKVKVIRVPEVFQIIGSKINCGIVLTDCTKGGNAHLMCLQGEYGLIPEHVHADFLEDMRLIDIELGKAGFTKYFNVLSKGSVYLQTSKKDGTKVVYLLDAENLNVS